MKRYEIILLILFIVLDSFHILFYEYNLKFDIYVFVEHKRYLCNIVYDLSVFIGFAALFYILWKNASKYYLAFLVWWLFNIAGYFLFYAQMINLFGLPILLIMLLWIKKQNGNTE